MRARIAPVLRLSLALLLAAALFAPGPAPAQEEQADGFRVVGHNPLGARGMNAALAVHDGYAYVGSRTDGQPQHKDPGILVVDLEDPTSPEVVHEIGQPDAGNIGETSRELRIWPEQELLVVLNFGCSSLIHACAGGEVSVPPSFTFFDISGDKAAAPELVARHETDQTPHEFYLWVDPERPAEHALLYWTAPTSSTSRANLIVTDISKARDGEFPEAEWVAEFPAGELESGEREDRRLHSIGVSLDGTETELSFLGAGYLQLDTSEVVEGVQDAEMRLITPPENRVTWTNPGAHTSVPLYGSDVTLVTDEVYGDSLDPITGQDHGCPWGWIRMIDRSDPENPFIAAEYKRPENQQEYCDDPQTGGFSNTTFTSYSSHNPTLTRELAFVTWHSAGLEVIDISDPAAPTQAGNFMPEPLPLVMTEDPALSMGDNKVLMWSYPIISDGLIYVIDLRNGLYVLEWEGEHAEDVAAIDFLEGNSNVGDALRLQAEAEAENGPEQDPDDPAPAPSDPEVAPTPEPSPDPSPDPEPEPEPDPDTEPDPTRLNRVAGLGRIDTAVEVSQTRRRNADTDPGGDTVVLARADAYPDALTGGPLAADRDAPLLLSASDRLSPQTAAEIERLGASRAVLLGGTAALSEGVASDLREAGLTVDRVGGANRYATAGLVADALGSDAGSAFVVEGANADPARGWPDAVSAAPLAAATGRPVLLTTADGLPTETAEALQRGEVTEAIVVGGSEAVGDGVMADLDRRGHGPRRVAGADRYATSAAVYDEMLDTGLDASVLWLATGRDWPDALTAGATVGALGQTLMLVDGDDLEGSPAVADVLAQDPRVVDQVRILGGPDAVSRDVEGEITDLVDAG